MIKLIALDLDGTTLKSDGKLSETNKTAIEAALRKGVEIVAATGRVFSALPEDIRKIAGIRYAITSNGAVIMDLASERPVYTNYIKESAAEDVVRTLAEYNFMVEVFVEGRAYIEKAIYDDVKANGSPIRNTEYLLTTREPIENLLGFALRHKDSIENFNVNFQEQNDKMKMRQVLMNINDISLTSSFDYNLEIGGARTSKGEALAQLCNSLNIKTTEAMACGDSLNDIEMLKAAGLSVAVENAKDEVKAAANYIVSSNNDNGVAEAIERFILE